jgi:ATP-dependent Lhr-like helicase
LARIHGYTQKRLRREIEPVSPKDFMRFLLEFQHVTGATRRRGQHGVLLALEQLQGFEAAAPAWEAELLPARVERYEPAWLDAECWSGQVVWGRLLARPQFGPGAAASVSLATPITLALREDFAWLRAAAHRGEASHQLSEAGTPAVLAALGPTLSCLRERGATFFAELARHADLSDAELQAALWDGVARGLLTADGFGALRALFCARLAPTRSKAQGRRLRRGLAAAGTRQPTSVSVGSTASEGRWAILTLPELGADPDELAEAVAEQLLARYGVVFRDLVARESLGLPWREILWAFRRLEARGQIRGGRFVAGFVGEQYALPEAVDRLRRVRAAKPDGECVRLSACDPLNLVGIVVPGARVPATRGNFVYFRDGVAVPPEVALAPTRSPALVDTAS